MILSQFGMVVSMIICKAKDIPVFAMCMVFADVVLGATGKDLFPYFFGMPGEEYRTVRGIVFGLFLDLPQLFVQTWILIELGSEAADSGVVALAFAWVTTVVSLLVEGVKIWKRSKVFQPTCLPMRSYILYQLGLISMDQRFVSAYVQLLRQDKYPSLVLNLRNSRLEETAYVELIEALEVWTQFRVKPACDKHFEDDISLILTNNRLSDTVWMRLAEAIENSGLRFLTLGLQDNEMTDVGAQRLALAIERRGSICIQQLNIIRNKLITKEGYNAILISFQAAHSTSPIEIQVSDFKGSAEVQQLVGDSNPVLMFNELWITTNNVVLKINKSANASGLT